MDIFKFIEKLQKKPEAARRKILLMTVFAIMGIIVIVWLTTFKAGVATKNETETNRPFDSIKEDFKDFYGFIKNVTTK
jgi:hypothetical protein